MLNNPWKVERVFIDVDIDEAIIRSDSRGTKLSRVDRESNIKERKRILKYYQAASGKFINEDTCVLEKNLGINDEVQRLIEYLACNFS